MFDHDTEDNSSCVGSRARRAETAGGVNWKRGNPCGSVPLSRADLNTEIFGLFCEKYNEAGDGLQKKSQLLGCAGRHDTTIHNFVLINGTCSRNSLCLYSTFLPFIISGKYEGDQVFSFGEM